MGLEGTTLIPEVSLLQITDHSAKVLNSSGFIHHLFPTTHQSSNFSALHKKTLHENPPSKAWENCVMGKWVDQGLC